jgi:hypothetical protein
MKYVQHFREDLPYTALGGVAPVITNLETAGRFVKRWNEAAYAEVAARVSDLSVDRPVWFDPPYYSHGEYYMRSSSYTFNGVAGAIGAYSMSAIDGDANNMNLDLLAVFTSDSGEQINFENRFVGLFARGSGATGAESCYYCTVRLSRSGGVAALNLYVRKAGADTLVATVAIGTGGNVANKNDYYVRFRAENNLAGTAVDLTAKVWSADSSETSAWTVTHSDSTGTRIVTAGWGGLIWRSSGATNTGLAGIGFLSAGTNKDVAPMPMSFKKFNEFLMNDTNQRVLIAEVGVLGSSNGYASGTGFAGFVCMATADYSTGPNETPANMAYDDILLEVPSFTVRGNDIFIGKAQQSYGDAIVSNENGERDNWLTYNWDGREFRQSLGGRGWPRWDFFRVATTTIKDVYAPSQGRIGFRMRDGSVLLDKRLNPEQIGGAGQNAGQYMSYVLGSPKNVPMKLYEYATLKYHVTNLSDVELDALDNVQIHLTDIRNNGSTIAPVIAITAAPGGGQITVVGHGLQVGCPVIFNSGHMGSFILAGCVGRVRTVVDANNVIIEDWAGTLWGISAAMVGTTVKCCRWKPIDGELKNGRRYKLIQLLTDPGSGQLTADVGGALPTWISDFFLTQGGSSTTYMATATQEVARACGAQVEYGTTVGIDPLFPTHYLAFFSDQDARGNDVMEQILSSVGGIGSFNNMGRFFAKQLVLPAVTHDFELLEDDIDFDAFKLERLILPSKVQQLGYDRNWTVQTSGLSVGLTAEQAALYSSEGKFTTVAEVASGDLDNATNHLLAEIPERRPTLLVSESGVTFPTDEATRRATMRSKYLGVYAMSVRAFQTFIFPGHRVKLTHSRSNFQAGKTGVVIGKVENYLTGVTALQVLFQLDSKFPTIASAGAFAGVKDYYQRTLPNG